MLYIDFQSVLCPSKLLLNPWNINKLTVILQYRVIGSYIKIIHMFNKINIRRKYKHISDKWTDAWRLYLN